MTPGGETRPLTVLRVDAGDPLAETVTAAFAATLEGSPAIEVVMDGAESGATQPAAPALLLLPRRATPRLPPADELTATDAALIARTRRWAAAQATAVPRRLVLVASALIHEPSHRQPGHVREDALPKRPPSNRVSRRWAALERSTREIADGAGIEMVTLRPSPVVGAGGGGVLDRLLSGRLAAVPAGYDPPVQPLPVGALVDAIRAALAGRLGPGAWHVAPDGVEPLHRALRRAGVRRLPVPTTLLRAARRLAGREPDEVEALRYPVTVSDSARRRALAPEPSGGPNEGPNGGPDALPPSTLERPAAELPYDPFSLDREYVDRFGRSLFRFLHDVWWRIEWRGLEHVPRAGGGVLVANHRGHQPWDGVMILHRLARDLGRYPRFLIHPALVKFPVLAPYLSRLGGIHACRQNGDWALAQGELLAVFPEGIRGAFRRYRLAHTLVPFRPDYVRFALRHRVPIVPLVVLGSAEIFPILGKLSWRWWRRVSEWPTLPITPTMSLVPLPSKWHVQVLEPLDVAAEHGPEAADDPAVYRRIDREVRRRMAATLESMRARRRHLFFGSIFDPEPAGDRA